MRLRDYLTDILAVLCLGAALWVGLVAAATFGPVTEETGHATD